MGLNEQTRISSHGLCAGLLQISLGIQKCLPTILTKHTREKFRAESLLSRQQETEQTGLGGLMRGAAFPVMCVTILFVAQSPVKCQEVLDRASP